MTKEEAIGLGIASRAAQEIFYFLGCQQTKVEPTERALQLADYEKARANMHEAMNKHHAALERLGLLPS